MVGIEYNFDINSLIIDLAIIRIAFVFPQKENGLD